MPKKPDKASYSTNSETADSIEALKKSEERFRLAMEANKDGIWDWNVGSNEIYFSPAYAAMLGYDYDEFPDNLDDFLRLIHPDEAITRDAVVTACIEGRQENIYMEARLKTKQGNWLWVLVRGKVVSRDVNGRATRIVGTDADITKRKLAEEAQKERDLLYKVFEHASCGINFIKPDLVFSHVSSAFCRMLGYTEEELVGHMTVLDITHPDDLAETVKLLDKQATYEIDHSLIEKRYLKKSGEILHVFTSIDSIFDNAGKYIGNVGACIDITQLKQSEQALERIHQLNEQIINSVHEGIIVHDCDLRVIAWNPFMELLSGVPASDVMGKTPGELFPFLHETGASHAHKRALKGETVALPDAAFLIPKTGKKGFASEVYSPIYDGSGNITGVLGLVHDITYRKQEEELINTRLYHEQFLSNLASFAMHADDVQQFNDSCVLNLAKLTGVDRALIVVCKYSAENKTFISEWSLPVLVSNEKEGHNVKEFCSPWLEKMLQGNDLFSFKNLNDISSSHTKKVMEKRGAVSAIFVPLLTRGEFSGCIAIESCFNSQEWTEEDFKLLKATSRIVSNFIEHRDTSDALHESEARFRHLFDSMPQGVTYLEPDGSAISINPAAMRFIGLTLEQLQGRQPIDPRWRVIREDGSDYPIHELPAMTAFKTGKPIPATVVGIVNPNEAEIRWLLIDALPLFRHDEGKPWQVFSVSTDITALKKVEEEKRRLQEQFAQAHKMESIGRLAGGIAHDFNNMLSVILGHCELVLLELDHKHPLNEHFNTIRSAASRSAELTRRLLAFARRQTVDPRVLNMNATVEGMINMLRRLIGEEIELTWVPAKGLWPVLMDTTQVDQILANLCVNARDAISGAGKVVIETQNVLCDATYCANHIDFTPGEYVLLSISDNGCGMTKEIMDKVFEPFFTTKAVGMGTGLGMSTVHGIVKQNNGFISIYSEPKMGTTCKIYLPRCRSKVKEIPHLQSEEKPVAGGEVILVVEDDQTILDMNRAILEKLGYQVLAESKPERAVALAAEHAGAIHLLMTDVVMPDMNGYELFTKLSSLYPDLKHLFVSGYTSNVIAHHGVLAEGVNFMQKPFSMTELSKKLRDILDSQNVTPVA